MVPPACVPPKDRRLVAVVGIKEKNGRRKKEPNENVGPSSREETELVDRRRRDVVGVPWCINKPREKIPKIISA